MELLLKRIAFCVILLVDVVFIAVFISYIISLFKIDVSKYEVISDKIPKAFDGFRILQLSDLHNKKFNKDNEKLINKIIKQNPDIIVITGDMVSSNSSNFDSFFDVINGLSGKYPIYYIFGNHEQRLPIEKQALIIGKLKEYGVKVLNNNSEFINKDDEYIQIYGITQSLVYYNNYLKNKKTYSYEEKDIKRVFPVVDKEKFNILLSHNPLYFEAYEKWGADLTFSGHVHGGLINIPFVGGLLSPERKLFPKYSGGEYVIDESKLIVSRGLGFSTINLRVFNNPEICLVELKAGS